MAAREKEKSSPECQKRREISQRSTNERRAKKEAARASRQLEDRAKTINDHIESGNWKRRNLSGAGKVLLYDVESGALARNREECDAAFGWNKKLRDELQSAAARMSR